MRKKLKIAYYCSNRTIFPPPKDIVAANAEVTFEIVKGMVKNGHDVTVYASKGSSMDKVKIVDLDLPPHKLDYAYQPEEWVKDLHIAYRITYISELINNSGKYDLIHFHVGRVIFGEPFIKFAKCPVIFTIHENLVSPFGSLMKFFQQAKLISISNAQRKTFPFLNYVSTIYHGVNVNDYPFNQTPKNNSLFINRISREKGVEFAIKVAQKSKIDLDIYGPGEKNYLKNSVLPYVNQKISYHGMVKKYSPEWYNAFSTAKLLLLPIQWEEPFGLVMIEAMACGTPVIAFRRGSVPEIIKD
ncbi:MAG: glycosyltransferase, partial [Minisyncoccales bacterium]